MLPTFFLHQGIKFSNCELTQVNIIVAVKSLRRHILDLGTIKKGGIQ